MSAETYRDVGASVDERVADLLGRMTLDEKVAQLGAIWVTQLVSDDAFDDAATRELLADGIGQITRIGASTGLLAEDSATLLNQIQRVAVEHTRLGIPVLLHEEASAGSPTAAPPPSRRRSVSRARGIPRSSARSPRSSARRCSRSARVSCSRRCSTWPAIRVGEGWKRPTASLPSCARRLGVAYVSGLQTSDLSSGVACAAKHFLGYAASMGGRNQAPVHVGGRELRDVYAMPFAAAIREAALDGIMNSYSSVDGLPCAGAREILTDLLRGELGFDGVVVADYFAVSQLLDNHRTAADRGEAAAQALTAGLDVELPSLDCYRELPGLVRDGRLAEETIDVAVERVLGAEVPARAVRASVRRAVARAAAAFDTAEQRDARAPGGGGVGVPPDQRRRPAAATVGASERRGHRPPRRRSPAPAGRLPLPRAPRDHVHERVGGHPGDRWSADADRLTRRTGSCGRSVGRRQLVRGGAVLHSARDAARRPPGCARAGGDGRARAGMSRLRSRRRGRSATRSKLATAADVAIVFVGAKSGLVSDCTVGEMRDAARSTFPVRRPTWSRPSARPGRRRSSS